MTPRRISMLAVGVCALSVAIALPAVPSGASTVKAGVRCASKGAVTVVKKVRFTCVSKQGRLVWNAGVRITPRPRVTPTSTASPTLPALTAESEFRPSSTCALRQTFTNYFGTGFGFPRADFRLKNTGDVRGLVIYVEFTDVKATDDPVTDAATYVPKVEEFFRASSYEAMRLTFDVFPRYLGINKPSTAYRMNTWSGGDPFSYWSDGLQAADPFVDFTPYDVVAVIPPSGIKEIIYGPSFPMPPGNDTGRTNEKVIYNGLVGGADQRTQRTRWIWMAHELGHDLGMEHQYSYDGQAIWDMMNNVYALTAPELFAWHRFLQGWIGSSRMHCMDAADLSTTKQVVLSPLVTQDDTKKMAVVRLDDRRALVAEVRRIGGFDTLDGRADLGGTIVYVVDVSKDSNKEAITMVTTATPRLTAQGRVSGALHEGESVTVEGITVRVLRSTTAGDYLAFSRR